MDISPWDLLFWGSLLLGAVAFIWGVATDDGNAESKREAALQKRLARYPADVRAVIIRGRPVAGWKLALCIILSIGLALVTPKLQTAGNLVWLCQHLGAAETSHLLLLLLFPGVPIVLMLPTLPIAIQSIRILRGGYAPPLDSAQTHDTIAVAGWRAKLRGVAGLVVMPLLVGFTGHLAYDLRQNFEANNAKSNIASRCPSGPSSKGGLGQ